MANWKEPKNDYTAAAQVTPEIFNTLAENERYLQEKKITTEQVQDANVSSVEQASRTNINDAEVLKMCIGKIRKWFSDLRALAFKTTVGSADIDSSAVTNAKLASSAVSSTKIAASAVTDAKIASVSASKVTGLHRVATSGDYNDLINKPSTGGGGGTVVFGGSQKYWDTSLGFVLKAGYRYTLVCEVSGCEMAAENVATVANGVATVRFCIPGECYGADSTVCLYVIELRNYYGYAAIKGSGWLYVEGYDISGSGSVAITVKKVIEGAKVF